MPSRRRGLLVALVTGLLLAALPLSAAAHVTVSTDTSTPEAFAVYTVRVPNESDTAGTIQVEVQLPEGLDASRYEPVPGWDISLADGVLTAEGGEIAPGQFVDFRFQARNPAEAGELTFPTVQTYSDGEVVSWTGAPDSDTPASTVRIGAADEDGLGLVTGLALGVAGVALLVTGVLLAVVLRRLRAG